MAPLIVEGTYKDGHIELDRKPEGVPEGAKVRVKFFDPAQVTEEERRAAGERMMARMEKGLDFGAPPKFSREEIYDERMDELDRRRGR